MAKSKAKNAPPSGEQLLAHSEEFDKETDRGAALLAVAYLDRLLAQLLVANMINDEEQTELLVLGHTAPLGTLSSRIRAAYCLGLISKDQHLDLHRLRDIRNDFAHELVGLSFNTQSIAARSRNLEGSKIDGQPSSPRECFKKAAVRLMVDLILKVQTRDAS